MNSKNQKLIRIMCLALAILMAGGAVAGLFLYLL